MKLSWIFAPLSSSIVLIELALTCDCPATRVFHKRPLILMLLFSQSFSPNRSPLPLQQNMKENDVRMWQTNNFFSQFCDKAKALLACKALMSHPSYSPLPLPLKIYNIEKVFLDLQIYQLSLLRTHYLKWYAFGISVV